jgi:hypothetical protein
MLKGQLQVRILDSHIVGFSFPEQDLNDSVCTVPGGLVTLCQLRCEDLAENSESATPDVWSLGVSKGVGVALTALWLGILIMGMIGRRFLSWQVGDTR